ncbi:hypothetical protein D3C74_318700 [compost metagenome]
MAAGEIVKPLYQRKHSRIAALPAKPIDQLYKRAVHRFAAVFFLKELLQYLLPQERRFTFRSDPKARIQRNQRIVALNDLHAEGVERCNRSPPQHGQLTIQILIVRILGKLLLQRFRDPPPHLRGRCFGERSDQQPINA